MTSCSRFAGGTSEGDRGSASFCAPAADLSNVVSDESAKEAVLAKSDIAARSAALRVFFKRERH